MAVHDEESMHGTRDPEAHGQDQVEHGLEGLAAQEHGERWQDYGEEVSHGRGSVSLKILWGNGMGKFLGEIATYN